MHPTLLLEIGCEELPTSFLDEALNQLGTLVPEELSRARIAHGAVRTLGTPRRLAVIVRDVSPAVASREEELLGPPESAARTPDGAWSKAAEGFARKNDLPVDALSVADTPKGRYVRAVKVHPGASAASLLPGVLAAVCRRIAFAKSMRWGDLETTFGRPIQWLVARYGEELVPLSVAGVSSGGVSRGHRFLAPGDVTVATGDVYVEALRAAHVLVDPDARRHALLAGLEAAAHAEGGVLVRDEFLEREVLGLVEEPHTVVGRFDPAFLDLPHALIQVVMRVHQRYFAVRNTAVGAAGQDILPVFLTVANTALAPDVIRRGNERVMRARLADAAFFVAQDRKSTLASRVAALDAVVFHAKLGSYGDKVRRLEALAPTVARAFDADEITSVRAATLCKADLTTLTVGEFPEMQGLMGTYFARLDGESEETAAALAAHHQPRSAADELPSGRVGATVAVADRLDTLAGCFAAGLRPTGSEDPFGLRRVAMAVLRIVLHARVHVSLAGMVQAALAGYARADLVRTPRIAEGFAGIPDGPAVTAVVDFLGDRLRGILEERFSRDVVAACLAARRDDPVDVLERVEALAAFWTTPAAADLAVAFRRVFNISREAPAGEPDTSLLTHPAEADLVEAFAVTRAELGPLLAERRYEQALELIARSLRQPVDRFFEQVFVMDKDEALRGARLRLLGRIADAVSGMARFDALEDTAPAR